MTVPKASDIGTTATVAGTAVLPAPAAASTRTVSPHHRRMARRRRWRRWGVSLLFLLPTFALIGLYRVYPAFESIRLSFTNWDGISEPAWVGWQNYTDLFTDDRFRLSLLNNAKLLIIVPVLVVIPFFIAALLQSRVRGWSFFRSVFFFPTLLSPVVIGLAFKMLLKEDGVVNEFLRTVGLEELTRVWLKDTTWALIWVMIIAAWTVMGTGVVLFLAAMGTVDTNLIEAAQIDGASWWKVQRHIVFWQILPIIELWTVLLLIAMLTQFFPMILIMTGGGPSYTTTTGDLYAYQQAFENFRSGYASAAVIVLTLITIVVIGVAMALARRNREA